MQLVIAEKPSVAQTIAKVLGATTRKDGYMSGNGYIVSWCVGHLVGLASPEVYDEKYKNWYFDTLPIMPQEWKFSLNSSTKDQYMKLKTLMADSSVDELVCATDAGREGECIFRYAYTMTKCKKPFKRLWISSLEESAIRDGFNSLKSSRNYDNLFSAGLCRAKADWLVGMNATRLFSVRYNSSLNIGRVQTTTLAMIVDRDFKVKNFIREQYFTVELLCSDDNGSFTAVSVERYSDNAAANAVYDKCNNGNADIVNVKREEKTVNPPKLYDLTTLQREANRQFGYTAQQTLDYTQSLYEMKLCTYPRTDSQYITEDMQQTAADMVKLVCEKMSFAKGIGFEPNVKRIANNSKVSDHTALLPTAQISQKDLSELPNGESNILSLIAAKLVCATAQPHKYEAVKADIKCGGNDFSATGKAIIENGWKEYDALIRSRLKGGEDKDDDKDDTAALPVLADAYENVAASIAEHWTSPPKPYTEDTLLSAMEHAGEDNYDDDTEKKGLGTPATRAAIIENLVKREYIERKKKQLFPTEKGINLISVVPDDVKSPKLTSDWEAALQSIEKGSTTAEEFMQSISSFVSGLCKEYGTVAENAAFTDSRNSVIGTCPKCGKNVLDTAKAYSCCGGRDGCGFVIWKSIASKKITAKMAAELLEKKHTAEIKGFKSKAGNEFSAKLAFDENYRVVFEFGKKG